MDRKYSIIIPIHNGQERLEACLGSIAAQSYENFEVLMIDDHSVDASAQSVGNGRRRMRVLSVMRVKNMVCRQRGIWDWHMPQEISLAFAMMMMR